MFKRLTLMTSLMIASSLLAGCGNSVSSASHHATAIRLTDDAHHTITLKKPATRIVTLQPSNAEIALDLGLKSELVGTDKATFQYTPKPWQHQLRGIPDIGPSIPGINIEEIVAAKPNLVIATGGITGLSALARFHIPVLVLQPNSINGIYRDIRLVGRATGKNVQARSLVAHMKQRIQRIQKAVSRTKSRPTVFYDLGGLYTVGPHTFLNSLISLAGATNVGARLSAKPYPDVTAEQAVKANPSIILSDARAGATVFQVDHLAGFSSIRALKQGQVYAVPHPSYVNEPSPAVVLGLEELVTLLHPHLKLKP